MGKIKQLFKDNLDYYIDDDYHYNKWLESDEHRMMWIPERDGRTLEDIELDYKNEMGDEDEDEGLHKDN